MTVPGFAAHGHTALKVPHMGWNRVEFTMDHPVLRGVPSGSYFYFVHSYYVRRGGFRGRGREGESPGGPVPPREEPGGGACAPRQLRTAVPRGGVKRFAWRSR